MEREIRQAPLREERKAKDFQERRDRELPPRELEVLRLIAQGASNPAVAQMLTISVGTVKAHTANIYSKLGVKNRVQALSRARELHLL